MASDLISRKELLELYEGLDGQGLKVPAEVVVQNIKDMPSVDAVEVVHGEWIRTDITVDDGWALYRCSHCNELTTYYYSPSARPTDKYCRECGAKMDGGDKE
jgi:hypothetical protein